MDEIIDKLKDTELDDSTADKLDTNLDGYESTFDNSVGSLEMDKFDVLPLEIVNFYCRTWFDDEDFIYVKFELPQAIQSCLAHERSDIITWLKKDADKLQDVSATVSIVYNHIIWLFDKVLDYYMAIDADCFPDEETWLYELVCRANDIIFYLKRDYNMNILSSMYTGVHPYYREVYYGLGIIITQLEMIGEYYKGRILEMKERHRARYMRLINNLCIIFIHNRFASLVFEDPCNEKNNGWDIEMANS
jgi:hypothetical protein